MRRTIAAKLRAAFDDDTPLTGRAKLIWLLIAVSFFAGPLASHLHKSLRTDHGDWLSIYNIAIHSYQTGQLRADEREPIVRTQRYPPITRPMLMLLALPPKWLSAGLSFALFAGLYLWCAWRLGDLCRAGGGTGEGSHNSNDRPAAPPRGLTRGRVFAAAGLLLCVLPYVHADLVASNLTSVLLASVTGAFLLIQRRRLFAAGVVLSIGIMLKMIPALCLLYPLVRQQWRVAWGALAGTLLLGVVPSLLIFGPRQLIDYHDYWLREEFYKFTPLRTIEAPVECTYQNQAIVRTLVRLFTHTNAGLSSDPFYLTLAEPPRFALKAAYISIMAVSAAVLLLALWKTRRNSSGPSALGSYALCVGAMLWFSPWVGSYYFSLAIWPAAALLFHVQRHADSRRQTQIARVCLAIGFVAMPALSSQWLRAWGATMWGLAALLIGVMSMARPAESDTAGGG